MNPVLRIGTLITASVFALLAQAVEPRTKVLHTPEDAMRQSVLVGRNVTTDMVVTFELEAAKSMWMQMDNPPKWRQRAVRKGETYHLDVRPIDPKSNAVIGYAEVKFSGVNRSNGKKVSGSLHPMWDASGLHYAANSPLAGDGRYELVITVGMPTVARVSEYRDHWLKPVATPFRFKLAGGKVLEVSEPMELAQHSPK